MLVCLCIIWVFKLLRNIDIRVFLLHAQRRQEALFDAGADIPGIVDEDHLRPVMAYQLSAFFADGIGHDDDRAVAFYGAHKGKPDALVAAGGLHDNRVRPYLPFFFRFGDHVVCGPCLNGAADVQSFKFH